MANNPLLLQPMTNRESMSRVIALTDEETGLPVEIMDDFGEVFISIQFEIRCSGPQGSGYTPWYDYGSWDSGALLTASVGNGITIIDKNAFLVYFSEIQMRQLPVGTMDVGCVLTELQRGADFNDDWSDDWANSDILNLDARQLFRGRLPIVDGYVTT